MGEIMTPKLVRDLNLVRLQGGESYIGCQTEEQAAAIVRACEHFDALVAAARDVSQVLPAEFRGAVKLRAVLAAIDGETGT